MGEKECKTSNFHHSKTFLFCSHKNGGFFAEVGAHDGVFVSNTLLFETMRNVIKQTYQQFQC